MTPDLDAVPRRTLVLGSAAVAIVIGLLTVSLGWFTNVGLLLVTVAAIVAVATLAQWLVQAQRPLIWDTHSNAPTSGAAPTPGSSPCATTSSWPLLARHPPPVRSTPSWPPSPRRGCASASAPTRGPPTPWGRTSRHTLTTPRRAGCPPTSSTATSRNSRSSRDRHVPAPGLRPGPADPCPGRAGRRGQAPRRRAGPLGHPGRRPRPHGGLPRSGQDAGGPFVRAGARPGVLAGPVHP